MVLGFLVLQLFSPDTLHIRDIQAPPGPASAPGDTSFGVPQLRIPTRQGTAFVWLLRWSDTVFVAAAIPDSTPYWGDDFVISIDIHGDGGPSPGHDDFQWNFRRVMDSSVVYRGRNGHWEAPKGDPDWRLGRERSGGGWEVSTRDGQKAWSLLLRLDPIWFLGADGRPARLAFRIFDNDPQGFFIPPAPFNVPQPSAVEQIPDQWAPVR